MEWPDVGMVVVGIEWFSCAAEMHTGKIVLVDEKAKVGGGMGAKGHVDSPFGERETRQSP